jgi:CHAT domain-containing protein
LHDAFGFEVNPSGSASLGGFLAGLPDAGVLHLAAHGYSMFGSPADNFVVLDSLGPGEPFLLTPYRLVDASTDAELATLAICMGGISESNYQDVRNMAYWFSFAGAHSCLYSHWKLDDRSTSVILSRFYANLADGMDRYDALRAAQDDYLGNVRSDGERNPIYWAGLTMIGEEGSVPIVVSTGWDRSGWILSGIAGLSVVAAILWFLGRRRGSGFRSS